MKQKSLDPSPLPSLLSSSDTNTTLVAAHRVNSINLSIYTTPRLPRMHTHILRVPATSVSRVQSSVVVIDSRDADGPGALRWVHATLIEGYGMEGTAAT